MNFIGGFVLFGALQTHVFPHSDLEWKIIYVGSSESSEFDQILEQVLVGPVTAGCHKFVLQADAPDPMTLPELLGVTVVLIAASYQNHEFVRIGYYVNNEVEQEQLYEHQQDYQQSQVDLSEKQELDEDETMENNSHISDFSKIIRTTLADKPRVTRFAIPWQTPCWHPHQHLFCYPPPEEVTADTSSVSMVMTSPTNRNDVASAARIVSPTNDHDFQF